MGMMMQPGEEEEQKQEKKGWMVCGVPNPRPIPSAFKHIGRI